MGAHLHPVRIRVQAIQLYAWEAGRTDALPYNAFRPAPLAWHAWSPSAFASRYASNPGTSPQFLLLAAGIPQRASRRTRVLA